MDMIYFLLAALIVLVALQRGETTVSRRRGV
jgi:hypothetical protein